jgi:hypothetical protein
MKTPADTEKGKSALMFAEVGMQSRRLDGRIAVQITGRRYDRGDFVAEDLGGEKYVNIIHCTLLVWSMFQSMKRAHLRSLGRRRSFEAALRNRGTELVLTCLRGLHEISDTRS